MLFSFSLGGCREPLRHQLVPFWNHFGVIFDICVPFLNPFLNLFNTGVIFEAKALKKHLVDFV